MYFTKDLYSDVIAKAKEQYVSLPRFIGFQFHTPFKEIQRESLISDSDWVKMIDHWIDTPSTYIPLYVVELQDPNILQTMAECIDFNAQTGNGAGMSEVDEWADNLLVTPIENSNITPNSEGRTCKRTKLVVRRESIKSFEVQPQPSFIDPESIPVHTECSLTSPLPSLNLTLQHSPRTEPDNNDKDNVHDGRGHKKLKRSKKKKKSVVDGGIQQFEITQLSARLLAKELKGLEAYDIPTLSKPYIPPLDTFFEEIVDLNQYGCDEVVSNGSKGCIEDDDEESDYEDSEEESGNSEEVSLDEESHSEEDFDVGVTSTEDMMLFGDPEDEEERGGQTIVNKMAKLYKTGRLWVRG
ncbi:unnamed protein product, partial [Cuscuta campestris]